MKKKILPACTMLCIASALHASGQSTLNATGGSAIIGTNEFEWSVGEMTLVNTFTTSSIIVTQGVLQTGLKTPSGVSMNHVTQQIKVFPNPSSSKVYVSYRSASNQQMRLVLTDLTGKVVARQDVAIQPGDNLEPIDLSKLSAASYMLSVTIVGSNEQEYTLPYKIQKLQ